MFKITYVYEDEAKTERMTGEYEEIFQVTADTGIRFYGRSCGAVPDECGRRGGEDNPQYGVYRRY